MSERDERVRVFFSLSLSFLSLFLALPLFLSPRVTGLTTYDLTIIKTIDSRRGERERREKQKVEVEVLKKKRRRVHSLFSLSIV